MNSKVPARLPRAPRSKEGLLKDSDKENIQADKKRKIEELAQLRRAESSAFRRHTIGKETPDSRKSDAGITAGRDSLGAQNFAENNEYDSNADVENLLQRKMAGKSKYDYKGRSEQMMEYIKELRLCVRSFQKRESVLLCDKGALQLEVSEQQKSHMETVSGMEQRFSLLLQEKETLDGNLASLQSQNADYLAKCQTSEVEATRSAQEIKKLTGDIADLQAELSRSRDNCKSASQQVETLQEINSRVQEYNSSLQQYNSQLQVESTKTSEELRQVQAEKLELLEEMASLKGQLASKDHQLQTAQSNERQSGEQSQHASANLQRAEAELSRLRREADGLRATVSRLESENARYRECTGKSASELENLSHKALALEESYASQGELISSLRRQMEVSKQRVQIAEDRVHEREAEVTTLMAKVAGLEGKLQSAEQRLVEGDLIRRRLHNTIQELKGNIRVFCRVRPLSVEEATEEGGMSAVSFPASDNEERTLELSNGQGNPMAFSYDKVFGPEASQAAVFEEIEQLVQSALDGYKVCIFAYGQTGSGKTHTMLGNPAVEADKGVIPRSLEKIFVASQVLETQGWSFAMQASMLEIYNENIRDLLGPGRAAAADWGANGAGSGSSNKQYTVKHDSSGNTVVSDLTVVEVGCWREVAELITRAAQSRSVGKTAMNEVSSRSHCVFTLRIRGHNGATGQAVNGVLNLIDLAGSERLSRSAATGDRLKETQAINKSLSSLGDVICALGNKEAHIPFRNSKLTYLLQPCLGGEAKTLMFVNIAPSKLSVQESLCSLRFAAKVNACEIGVAKRNTASTAVRADSARSGSASMC